ncbi:MULTISPECIES: hypothetical protein [unclassified Acinetobacter]|uniref:hypothetical protein n=1 Tax=unclassified Acinetobacter TaxID=196816 RepID=UPI001D0E5F98|nr:MULTISPECIES: hypothetical protein [unclassified Acinetobacter]
MVIVRVEKTWLNVINHALTKTGQGYHFEQSVPTLNLNNHGYVDVFLKNIDRPVQISLKV